MTERRQILFETKRLRIRPWTESDARSLFKYASDPEVREIFSNGHTWAIELKESGEAVGCICYYDQKESNIPIGEQDAEIGYWIGKPHWNRGLATEALRGMVDYCFNTRGFLTLWSDFFVDNPASGRVMEKCGFRDTGEENLLSHLYRGDERPVRIMRLDYAL